MSIELRDHFAGLALQALIGSPKFNGAMGNYVTDAYTVADAMLKERERVQDVVITEKPIEGGVVDMEA